MRCRRSCMSWSRRCSRRRRRSSCSRDAREQASMLGGWKRDGLVGRAAGGLCDSLATFSVHSGLNLVGGPVLHRRKLWMASYRHLHDVAGNSDWSQCTNGAVTTNGIIARVRSGRAGHRQSYRRKNPGTEANLRRCPCCPKHESGTFGGATTLKGRNGVASRDGVSARYVGSAF